MNYPAHVTLIEVGPRDGLQNEATVVPTSTKIKFIDALSKSGLQEIEVTSFVSSKRIPQLQDNTAVCKAIHAAPNQIFSALVPNEQGMHNALAAGIKKIAIFTAASETFNQRNINCSIAESLLRFKPVINLANINRVFVRAYISCALGCPYEGYILPYQVLKIALELYQLGVNEICLGDTIGVGTPQQTAKLLETLLPALPAFPLAMHFHDTYGQAIANIHTSLQLGLTHFDSAVAGLGGCPYARGATGNVATEDVLYLLHGLGIETGVDIFKIVKTGDMICRALGKKNQSKVANALLANQSYEG